MKRILTYMTAYWKSLLLPVAALLLSIGLDALNPFLNRMVIDQALPGRDLPLLIRILIGLLGISLSRAALGFFKEYTFDKIGTLAYRDLRDMLFDHIQSLHFKYFDNINTGEIMSRLGEDLENIWRSLAFGFRLLIENALYFLLSLFILSFINLPLTLIILAIMSPIGFIAVRYEKRIDKNYGEISDHTAELNTTAQENIAGVRLVKAFAREKFEIDKFLTRNRKNYDLNNEQALITANHFPPIELLTNLALVAMIAFGAYFVSQRTMTLGSLAVFSGLVWNLIWPLRELGWVMNMAAQFSASARKILAILDTESEITDEPGLEKRTISGGVEFRNVSFAYNDEEVLTDVSFQAQPGDTIAVMGTTGAGKSSLIGLIGRYYVHQSGQVLVDGLDTSAIRLDDLRGAISIVPQDTFLFSETIANNLRFARPEATEGDMLEALSIAQADFIAELDEGLETVIGERGVGLSGGQKQRLAIARAILKDSPILILDDATSALDMETEYQLLKNLKTVEAGRTTFIIAHRISAVKNATRILYMEDGRIVESGSHDELVARRGRYYEVYREQFRDFEQLQEVI